MKSDSMKLHQVFDSKSQNILLQVFGVIQSDVALYLQVH